VSDRGRDFRNHFRSVLTVSVKDDEHSKVVGARIVETRTEGRTIPAIGWMLDYGGPSLFGYPGRLVVRAIVDHDNLGGVTARSKDDAPDGLLFVECRNCCQEACGFGLRSEARAGRRAVVSHRQEIPPWG